MASASPTTSPDTGRIDARFRALRGQGRRALIPYLTAGYPEPAATADLLDRLVDAGADILEIGVPFSDPLADGPTIQRASFRAIERGASLARTLDEVAALRRRSDVPVVLFSYLNPVLAFGVDAFIAAAGEAGVDGVLLTDLPLDADPALEDAFEASPLALVRLVAPTTPPERAARIATRTQGFLYYIARTGVTGAGEALRAELGAELAALRARAATPVVAGFGISTPEHAAALGRAADGIVVGSALIDALDRGGPDAAVALLRSLRGALDAGA